MKWREHATLMQADYRDTLAAVEGRADLVLTSPPFADARTYGHDVSWSDADYQSLGDAVFAALKPGGHAIINIDAPVRASRPGFGTERGLHPWRLLLDWADRVGFRVPDRLAFGRRGQPGAFPGRFRNDWEPLLWFQRPGAEGWISPESIRVKVEPYRTSGGGRRANGQDKRTGKRKVCDFRNPGTLWEYGNVGLGNSGVEELEDTNHPARWPYRLARDVVKCFCPPGGLAVDPFTGSGTSLLAALDEGRRFHGGDLYERQSDKKPWVDVAAEIAEARYAQLGLFELGKADEGEPEWRQEALFG